MADTLAKIYYDAENPASFSSDQKLYKAAKELDHSITLDFVRDWLARQLTYTLHKQKRIKFPRSKIVVADEGVQWQADLADLQMYSKFNKGIKYILTVVDTFSRYAWVKTLKTKSGKELADAFQEIFAEEIPASIQTDNGKEFKNKDVQDLFQNHNIRFFTTTDEDIKCAMVERFNRTLKNKMFKIMTKTGKRCYISYLDSIVKSYNNSVNRSIGYKPVEVDEKNKDEIFKKLYGYKDKREMLIAMSGMANPKLKIGDLVRIRYQHTKFDRGYIPNWTDEVYEIIKCIKGTPSYYKLKDYKGNEIEGRFYAHEIQKVIDPTYRVERILRTRTRGGIRESLVKWVNFPSTENQWIPSADIADV